MNRDAVRYPILREARVVSVDDPNKLGRIQVKVIPELEDIPDGDCPWAFPLGAGAHGKDFALPSAGAVVYAVVFNRFWCEIAFIPCAIAKPTGHLFADWVNGKKPSITDMAHSPEEATFEAREWDDGFTEYHDSKNKEHGFLHPSGTFVTIDKDGQVFVQSVKKINVHDKEGKLAVSLDSGTGDVAVTSKGKVSVSSVGDMGASAQSAMTLESPNTTLKGGNVTINGTVAPRGSGALCGIPSCIFNGAPHVGPTAAGCQ